MYLVFDIGGTYIKCAVMDDSGAIAEKSKTRTPLDATAESFAELLAGIWQEKKKSYSIDGISLSLPGQVDVENGIIYGGGALKFLDRAPLASLVSERCGGIKTAVENDGKCAALAEVWCGNASDADNACVLVFGTGIGGGIIKDRKVHHGNHLLAGEISFCFVDMTFDDLEKMESLPPLEQMTLEEAFDNMTFSWSCFSSTAALVQRVARSKGLPPSEVSGELIYQWIDEGDSETERLVEEVYFSVAKMCCNLYVLFDPDIILIGGGISAQPAFLQGIQRYIERLRKISRVFDGIKTDVCRHRNDSNLLGALYNYKQKFENTEE